MRKLLTFSICLLFLSATYAQNWTGIAADFSGDGNSPTFLDGVFSEYEYFDTNDSLAFRITVEDFNSSTAGDWGVNLMVNIPNGGTTFNFWGADNMNPFHKLVTIWVTGTPPSNYTGTIGISDQAGVGVQDYTNLHADNIAFSADTANNYIEFGMKRTDLITDVEFPGNSETFAVAAAVGSSFSWNDDIYTPTGSITITKMSSGIDPITESKVQFYPNPSDDYITVDQKSDVSIYTLDGKLLIEELNVETIFVGNLNEGTYLIKLGDSHLSKFVKQ